MDEDIQHLEEHADMDTVTVTMCSRYVGDKFTSLQVLLSKVHLEGRLGTQSTSLGCLSRLLITLHAPEH